MRLTGSSQTTTFHGTFTAVAACSSRETVGDSAGAALMRTAGTALVLGAGVWAAVWEPDIVPMVVTSSRIRRRGMCSSGARTRLAG